MQSLVVNGNELEYDEHGAGPALLLMSGWCQDHRLFKNIVAPLARKFRVIRLNWRGHNAARTCNGDFVTDDQIDDVVKFLDAKGIEQVLPLSTSHGGWTNIGIADKLGVARVPKVIAIDWLMKSAFTELLADLRAGQDPAHWKAGRDHLFHEWLSTTDNQDVIDHVWKEFGEFDAEMWIRSCREIERAYAKWQGPLERIHALAPARPVAHIFSQPIADDYLAMQQAYAQDGHPWFQPIRIPGKTHFPTLESPDAVVQAICGFAGV